MPRRISSVSCPSYWDESTHAFSVNPGAFDILIGAFSDDIRETARIQVAR